VTKSLNTGTVRIKMSRCQYQKLPISYTLYLQQSTKWR